MKDKLNILLFSLLVLLLVFYLSDHAKVVPHKNIDKTMKVNINVGGKEEIMALPFIGEKKANRIIEQRRNTTLTPTTIEKILGKKAFTRISSVITY